MARFVDLGRGKRGIVFSQLGAPDEPPASAAATEAWSFCTISNVVWAEFTSINKSSPEEDVDSSGGLFRLQASS